MLARLFCNGSKFSEVIANILPILLGAIQGAATATAGAGPAQTSTIMFTNFRNCLSARFRRKIRREELDEIY